MARSVLVDEITEAYERLHATISLGVLHRAVERFEFGLPDGFEITDVATPQLARWAVVSPHGRRVLEVYLREPATESVVLTLSAIRTNTDLAGWQLSRFVPLGVMAESAVVGLLVDQRLMAEKVASDGLIPIDTAVLRRAIPETVLQAAPGAPAVRPIVAWYAPRGEFAVSARFVKPPAEVAVMTNLLLVLQDQRQRVQGGFLLRPEAEPLFETEIDVPPSWRVTSVTGPEQESLPYECYGALAEAGRVKVRLPRGVHPNQEYRIYFEAESVPSGWLGEWTTQNLQFPRFLVRGAGSDIGAIAVDAQDDMVAQPEPDKAERLSILGKEDKARHLAGVATDLAYRYESPEYRLPLVVRRTSPRITAHTFSFLRVEPDALVAHYELVYDVEEARTRTLSLLLPAGTPETVAIRGLDGLGLKEYVSSLDNGSRRWHVLLAEPRAGGLRLAVDFYQPRVIENQQGVELPIALADGVIWQSGHLAVEGDAELEVSVAVAPPVRRCDVGELVEAQYQPGQRLLGVFAFADRPGAVKLDVVRREGHSLCGAVVHRTRLASRLSAAGICQTEADFQMLTKVSLIEVALPPKAELWSGTVNGEPIRPQKEGDCWLINLPATQEGQTVALHLVYEMSVGAIALHDAVNMDAPQLRFRGHDGQPGPLVPIADFQWDLYPPTGCTVLDSSGTVIWQPERPEPAIWILAKGLGGFLFGSPFLVARRARSAQTNWRPSVSVPASSDHATQSAAAGIPAMPGAPAADKDLSDSLKLEEMDAVVSAEQSKPETPRPAAAVSPPQAAPAPLVPPSDTRGDAAAARQPVPQRRGFKGAGALPIALQGGAADEDPPVTFRSLGTAPRLAVAMADGRRLAGLGWGIGLLVAFAGVCLTTAPVRRKAGCVLAVIGLGSLIPLLDQVFPFLPDMSATLAPANAAVYAAGLLLPYYLLAGFVRWFARVARFLLKGRVRLVTAASLLMLSLPWGSSVASAQPPAVAPYVVEIVDPLPPVAIPADAVVIPYDATRKTGLDRAERILVPYARYVELWDLAYPDRKRTSLPPPASYSPAGVAYQTTLVDEKDLLVDGRMEIDVFAETRIEIPLGLENGVLTRADLDGAPARLSIPVVAAAAPDTAPVPSAAPVQQALPEPQTAAVKAPASIVLLHVEGKGRHVLEFAVRMRLERRGGWRAVQCRLPVAPAAAIEIQVPLPQTEVLLQNVDDHAGHKTEKADERIHTALGPDGILSLQWRPTVAEGVVDHSLTAESDAMLDVQEDGVRLAWHLQLEFGRSRHEQFSLRVPKEYLVERIDGTNVRGWEIEKQAAESKLTVTLLKTAEQREEFTVRLWLAQAIGGQAPLRFASPVVRVDGAALHQGRITIRRSPLLDLRVEGANGATRTDVPENAAKKELATQESPLGIRPFQTYRFGATDYEIRLAAQAVDPRITASLQSVLRITQYERLLECRVRYAVSDRKLYRVEILLPEAFQLQDVSLSGQFEWSVTDHGGRPKLTLLLGSGQEGDVTIVFEGRLPREEAGKDVAIPNVQILGVPFSPGQMAVQVDPAYDVAARDLAGCSTILLDQIAGWVSKDQQHVTALALLQTRADYSGILRLSQRRPDVQCQTITNICMTDRALKETIFLDYRIEHAGVREISLVLPSWMADARVSVPMLRQKTIRPEGEGPNPPLRFQLELQDEVMGELRVLVENDRTLQTAVDLEAPIPQVIKGDSFDAFSVRQFVTLEKAGLDDIQWEKDASSGLQPIKRQQGQWAHLASILKEGFTEAFLVADGRPSPRLVFRARRFEARRTTDARIGMAETRLVLDGSGAYRAEQLYWIDNKTEQYLEISMPQGADLWTAQLWTFAAWTAHEDGAPAAGEPVKPTRAPASAGPGRIRIPLVKTAEGDSDYVIRLQYGGTIDKLATLTRFDLPFIQPLGIKVDESHVRLYLPETHWFDFDDTMSRVDEEGDLLAGRWAYKTRQLEKFSNVLREGNPYAQARALNSVNVLNAIRTDVGEYGANARFREEERRNQAVSMEVQKAAERVQESLQQTAVFDNRDRLRQQVDAQSNYFAKNVVQGLESNFKADRSIAGTAPAAAPPELGSFNTRWLDQSRLSSAATVATDQAAEKEASPMPAQPQGQARIAERSQRAEGRDKTVEGEIGPGVSQKKTPAVVAPNTIDEASLPVVGAVAADQGEKQRKAVARYQARHMEQQQALARPGYVAQQSAQGQAGGGAFGYREQLPAIGQPAATSQSEMAGTLASMRQPSQPQVGSGTAAPLPAGLASLDVSFPFRGREYRFMTPQGDVRITGRAFATQTVDGLVQVIAILLILAAAACAIRLGTRGRLNWWIGRAGSTWLILIGLLALLCLPVIGMIALLGGVMVKVNRFTSPQTIAASPFVAREESRSCG